MLRRSILVVLFILAWHPSGEAETQSTRDARLGELLYNTHCIGCHNEQVHWRDKKIAKDWPGLQAEVRRWQRTSGLRWSNEDVVAVTRYLNALHYHYPVPD